MRIKPKGRFSVSEGDNLPNHIRVYVVCLGEQTRRCNCLLVLWLPNRQGTLGSASLSTSPYQDLISECKFC